MHKAPLTDLLSKGLQLWQTDGKLGFKAPSGRMSPELKEKLVAAKPLLRQKLILTVGMGFVRLLSSAFGF